MTELKHFNSNIKILNSDMSEDQHFNYSINRLNPGIS